MTSPDKGLAVSCRRQGGQVGRHVRIIKMQFTAGAKCQGAMQQVFEFADIALKRMAEEQTQCVGRHDRRDRPRLAGNAFQQCVAQSG